MFSSLLPAMKTPLPLAVFLAFSSGQAIAAGSNTADMFAAASGAVETKRQPSDMDGVDWIASYEPGPLATPYQAETASTAPVTDSYARERDADRGLVFLKDQHDRRVKQYTIPGASIRAIVHIRYDMSVLDRIDLVFTSGPSHNLIAVHTATANAGIFTGSDIYPLEYRHGKVIDTHHLIDDPALGKMITMGVSLYREAAPAARSTR
jgi:hypothetical protein